LLAFKDIEKFNQVGSRDFTYRFIAQLRDDVTARATFNVTPLSQAPYAF
jgi:hypothetical protein